MGTRCKSAWSRNSNAALQEEFYGCAKLVFSPHIFAFCIPVQATKMTLCCSRVAGHLLKKGGWKNSRYPAAPLKNWSIIHILQQDANIWLYGPMKCWQIVDMKTFIFTWEWTWTFWDPSSGAQWRNAAGALWQLHSRHTLKYRVFFFHWASHKNHKF